MLFVESFLIGLAANLAFALMQAGSARLKQALLGTSQEQALQRAYQAAFEAALRASAPAGDEASARRVADHLQRFLALPGVADTLLDMALVGALTPDLDLLDQRYASLATDGDAPPIDINRILVVFHGRLTTALVDEASAEESPLYNQVSLARIQTIHALLRGQQHSLRQVSHLLQRLEAQPGIYNIIIEQATGVAIGDGATVNQFPEDVRLALAEVLAAVRELNAERRPPTYSQKDLHSYLDSVIERCQTLHLQGAGGPVDKLPLERVYVALKADASNVTERWANFQQLRADIAAAYDEALAVQPEVDERERWKLWRAIAMSRDPMGLTLAFRQRASAVRGDFLATAAPHIDLGELIARERWAVLLGDPGAGKTTLIRWLAMQFARALLADETRVRVPGEQVRADANEQTAQAWADLGPARLPVPMQVVDYAAERWRKEDGHDTALSLFEYLGRQPLVGQKLDIDPAVSQAIVHDALRQGRALILLDGLDEIADQYRRGQVVDAIVHFLRTWVRDPISGLCAAEEGYAPAQEREEERPRAQGGNQVLITSRPIGYYLAPLPATLAHYTVEEMSEPAIAGFCRAWTAAVHQETGQGDPAADAEALRQAVLDPDRPALREIAANPLLLTIMAGLFYTLKGQLPERRVELYDHVVKAFTRQRHEAWQAHGLSDARFRFAMGYTAVQLHANPERSNQLAGEDDVKEWLEKALEAFDGQYVPKQGEQAETLFASAAGLGGFLLERGDGAYGFIHRTLQEYFAALYLAHNPATVASEVCSRLDEPAWHVPLTLAVAQTAAKKKRALPGLLRAILDAPEPAPGLLPRNALFLATCLPEFKEPPPAEIVTQAVGQLLAAYADRAWPANETMRPPKALRAAIERSLRPLRRQLGARVAMVAALMGDAPALRLAASELILATEWKEDLLVDALLAAIRDHSEPIADVRRALCLQLSDGSDVLAAQNLPLRLLLADRAVAESVVRRPVLLAILRALYMRPDWRMDQPLYPTAIWFDSLLSPWLERAILDGWTEKMLSDQLLELAWHASSPAMARDAAWALAIVDDQRWRQLLEASGDAIKWRHPVVALAWNASAGANTVDFDLLLDLPLALAIVRAQARDLDLDLGLDLAISHAMVAAKIATELVASLDFDRDSDRVRVWSLLQEIGDAIKANDSASILRLDQNRDLRQVLLVDQESRLSSGDHDGEGFHLPDLPIDLDRTRAIDVARVFDHYNAGQIIGVHIDPRADMFGESLQDSLDYVEHSLSAAHALLSEGPQIVLGTLRAYMDSAIAFLAMFRAEFSVWRALASVGQLLGQVDPLADQDERLLRNSSYRLADATAIPPDMLERLRVEDQARMDGADLKVRLRDLAVAWLEDTAAEKQCYGALLLADLGEVTEASFHHLLSLLVNEDDLLRQRAREALVQERLASGWEQAALLALARQVVDSSESLVREIDQEVHANALISLYCADSLSLLIHDHPDWLRSWANELDAAPSKPIAAILRNIGFLTSSSWPTFLDLLWTSGPRTQEALLGSVRWLRRNEVHSNHYSALVDGLLTLTQSSDEQVSRAALLALGCFPVPSLVGTEVLIRAAHQASLGGSQPTMVSSLCALAQMASRLGAPDQAEVDRLLATAPASPEVDGALARRLVSRQEKLDVQALLKALAALRPDVVSQLRALLAAGTDDAVWDDDYHDRIALTVRLLLMQHETLWPILLEELRSALAAGSWERQRIALASLARCAEAMPAQFNRSAADFAPLLLQATRNADSFNARRFAITCLSYLRVTTPEVLAALLRLAGDMEIVQKDALAAAARFNRLDPSLGEALPAELTAALTGPSVLRALTAARLLQTLGTSQAAQAAPGLRRQIVQALAAALQDPGSRRPVWISTERTDGTLDQDLYQALLRVAGF